MKIELNDFLASEWRLTLDQASREGYSAMWLALSAAARSAIEQGRNKDGKVFWLLADACSMLLSPSSTNEPFKPYAIFHDRRSVIPDDMHSADILFFAEIVDEVDDYWLKARLSDLVWLKGTPRNTEFALKAIDAYRCVPLDLDAWIHGGRDCWSRAIGLAKSLKSRAGDRLEQMEVSIITAFNAASRTDGFFVLWLAELLKSNGLGRAHRADVARKLEALGKEFDSEGDLDKGRAYFIAAVDWNRVIPDVVKAAEMTVAVAEGWVKEAIALSASGKPSHMLAASCYENAIQTYRTVPKIARATHQVDKRISELRAHLNDSGEKSLEEMSLIRTPGVDISQIVENARKSVTGKAVKEALLAFANLYQGAKAEELRNSTLARMRQFPMQFLFSLTMMSRDGRVIAKRPAIGLSGELTKDDEIAIRAEMIRDYGFLVRIVVQGDIWPALDVLLQEHRLTEADFIELAHHSSIVPRERAGLLGKALFAGYERDFVTALHLLIPQVEHLVRVHLKQAGAKTTNIDLDGIQNENGMSTLMDLPEAEQVFGRDLVFEFKSLFCDAFGPNLRNELAHGLLDEDDCHSPYAIYAWWLVLRLTLNAWWNRANK